MLYDAEHNIQGLNTTQALERLQSMLMDDVNQFDDNTPESLGIRAGLLMAHQRVNKMLWSIDPYYNAVIKNRGEKDA